MCLVFLVFAFFSLCSCENPPPNTIWFYNKNESYYEFTNFWAEPNQGIVIDSLTWPTSEHFFQASKFVQYPDLFNKIRTLPTARDAFNFAHQHASQQRCDWFRVNVDVMWRAVSSKFSQIQRLHVMLMGTGNKTLVEHTKEDSFWGDGGDGSGKNMQGKLLMQLRDALRTTDYNCPNTTAK